MKKKININININNIVKNNIINNNIKKNKFEIKKELDEIELYYKLRKLFYEKMNKNTKITLSKYKLLEMYSHILINIIFLKCRYQEKTEKIIKEFIDKYKNDIKNLINRNITF